MYGKKLSKASQELLWTDADQNDSFSNSSYLFPIQRILQNEVMIARTEANSILDLEWFNVGHLLLVGSNSGTFFGKTTALRGDAVIDCLVRWVQWAPAVYHSPSLDRSCLHAWTQLTYLFSLLPVQSSPFYFAMSRIFYFAQCPNRQGVRIISEWSSYMTRVDHNMMKNDLCLISAIL